MSRTDDSRQEPAAGKTADAPVEPTRLDEFGRFSINTILGLLIAAILVPALIFAGVLLQRNNQAQMEMVASLAEATSGSISETVDRQLNGMLTTLRVLSTSTQLTGTNLAAFHARTQEALADSGSYLIVADDQGHQLLNTRVPYGTPLDRVSDLQTVTWAFSTGNPAISDGFQGRVAQRWVFNVILPTTLDDGRELALILTQDAANLGDSLASQNLRGGWNAVLLDRQGIVLSSSYVSSDIGKPFFLAASTVPTASTVGSTVDFEGQVYQTIRTQSELSGWTTVVWAPSDVVEAPMKRSLRFLALGGLAIIMVGSIMAWALGRQITGPIRRLARDARRLGAGHDVEPVVYPVAEITTVSLALAQASKDRQAAENEIRFLMREVAHRSKNQLTVVSSIAKQTARYARNFATFQDSFQKRVQGLAKSTDLLIAGGVAGVELKELLEAQIEPFRPSDDGRLEIRGPQFRLSNQAAQTLGLAIHELATNAAKYGAFANPQGRLQVGWKWSNGRLVLSWREFVPRLRRRSTETRGFGTEVIERMLGGTLGAEIERTLHPDGLECVFTMPRERLEPDIEAAAEE